MAINTSNNKVRIISTTVSGLTTNSKFSDIKSPALVVNTSEGGVFYADGTGGISLKQLAALPNHSHDDYLPKTGGTVTGPVKSSSYIDATYFRPSLVAASIQSSIDNSFRTTFTGTSTQLPFISTSRTGASAPGKLLGSYAPLIAFGAGDTHGFLQVPYSSAGTIRVGGGNGDSIKWTADLIHSGNISSQSVASATNATNATKSESLAGGHGVSNAAKCSITYLAGGFTNNTTPTANQVYLGTSSNWDVISSPVHDGTDAVQNIMSLRLGFNRSYWHEIATGPNANNKLYHRSVNADTPRSWALLLDSLNYTDYCASVGHTHSYLPLSGGLISGGNITFGSSGLPSLSGNLVPAGQMGIASNGIIISGKETYNDGAAIFVETTANEANKLIIALGDDANTDDIMTNDYIAFRYYGTDGAIHAESKIPKNTGIIALTSDIPTKVSQLSNDAGYTTATGHTHTQLPELHIKNSYFSLSNSGNFWIGVDTDGQLYRTNNGWTASYKILDSNNYTAYCASTGHTHSYLPLSGGTVTGAVTFANNTWNVVGDDAAIGDFDAAGLLGLKSCNNNIPGIGFHNSSNTLLGILSCDAGNLKWNNTITAKNFITNSDRRLKTNINEISSDKLSNSLNLNFVEFDYKDNDNHSAGHIAQEVKEVLPEFVHGEETETEHLSIDYTGLHSIQIKALLDRIIKLEEEIKILKSSK